MRWTGKQRGGVAGHWIFHQLLRGLGRDAAGLLLYPVSLYFTLTSPPARRASCEFFRRARKFWAWDRLPSTYAHFLSFSRVLLDRAALLSGWGGKFSFEFDGEEHIRAALREGRGVLMISAHVGNWEAAGRALGERLPAAIRVAMAAGREEQRLAAFLEKNQNRGFSILPLDGGDTSGLEILASLRRGEVVAMHADRSMARARQRRVSFLGKEAGFPEGPFQIAAVAGCPLITCFALRVGRRRYRLQAFAPESLAGPRQAREAMVQAAMLRYAQRLESVVREYPLQWFNFYPFWG